MRYKRINYLNNILALCFSMAVVGSVFAVEDDNNKKINEYENSPAVQPTLSWVDGVHGNITGKVDSVARRVDEFFAGEESLEDNNKSYVRWRVSEAIIEGDGWADTSDIKFRIDLPTAEKRFRLVIENSPEDAVPEWEQNQPDKTESDSTEKEGFSVGLQSIRELAAHWSIKSKIGVKLRSGLDPFVKSTLKRRWALGENWSMPYRFSLSYFHDEGFSANNSLSFERKLEKKLFLRVKTEVEWDEDLDKMEALQTVSVYKRLTKKSGMEYVLGVDYQSASHTVVNNYFMSADYRKLVHKDWLYIDIIPQLGFAREDDYQSKLSLTLRLEVFFQKEPKMRL